MNSKTTAAGLGVTAMAVLTLFVSTQGLAFAQWVFGEIKVIAGLPLFGPVTIAVIVGAIAPAWLPHVLPATWPRAQTLRVTRLLACAIAFVMIAARYPSAIGLQYAMFAASGAFVLWTIASNWVYRVFPGLKPPALVDEDFFCETVRRRALEEGRRIALREIRDHSEAAGEADTETGRRVRQALGGQ